MTTILITPAVAQALRAWNSDIARARHDYETEPTRSCRWVFHDKPCWTLRGDDPVYCRRHRAEAAKCYARKAAKRARDNARRREARAAA